MDEDLITHSLRGIEVQPDIYYLALQHLTSDSEDVVRLVVDVIRRLLKKSPKNFWSAFQAISPAVVAEQIFASPGFEKLLEKAQDFEHPESSLITSWIPDFIGSLQPIHQHDACRCLLNNLLERLQDARFSETARLSCCRAGLDALSATLQTFVKTEYKINPSTSLIVIGDIMGLVNANIATITGCADLQEGDKHHLELKRLGMLVIRDVLALDCKALSAEFYALEAGTKIQRGLKNHSQSIWQAVLGIFRPGNLDLAKSILAATSALTGLDQIWPANKRLPKLSEDQVQYNKAFKQLNDNVSRVFDRLSEFEAPDLRQLYENPQTARPMFAGLLSADQNIYAASVLVLNAMTVEESKEEATLSLLEQAFAPTLNSFTFGVTRIIKARKFSPVPYMLNIGRLILNGLCDNTGVLRMRSTLSASEQTAVMAWWSVQWRAMDMIFSNTEAWATRVDHTTQFMQDFCRDAMEYAESLFNQHSVLASALCDQGPSDDNGESPRAASPEASVTKVLDVICHHVNGMTMMIRLRDGYLVSQITDLLSKLLRCLGQYDLEIDEFASNYIRDACRNENDRLYKRTNLTRQQKAELTRTLDEHQGLEIIEMPHRPIVKKQSTIDSWSKSADGVNNEPSFAKGPKLAVTLSSQTQAMMEKQKAKSMQNELTQQQFRDRRRQAEEEKKRVNAEAVAKAKALRGAGALVRGEGSGLKDIGGIVGKDHAPVRSEIMVGSSDEDSDEDVDEDETNALVKSRKATSKKVTEYEESRRRALKQQQQGPVKKTKIQRSAKDMRARVEPNMDKLYLEILNWDIFHPGDKPPSDMECIRIEDKFLELGRYQRIFFPLLISEVWRSLVTAKDENNFKPIETKVLNRLSIDNFMEVSTNMPTSLNRDLKMAERDIVLLSRSPDPLNNPQEPHCLARVDRTSHKKDVLEVIYRVSRDIKPPFLQLLVPNGKIYAIKIADMTTTQREYAALSSLEFYDLCSEVLEAKPSPIQKYGNEKVSMMLNKYNLNRGQAQAILSAYDNDGFTLIQG
jgi:senataxin